MYVNGNADGPDDSDNTNEMDFHQSESLNFNRDEEESNADPQYSIPISNVIQSSNTNRNSSSTGQRISLGFQSASRLRNQKPEEPARSLTLAERELAMKENYYKAKLNILEQKNLLLSNQHGQMREQQLLMAQKNAIFERIASSLEKLCDRGFPFN